MNEKVKNIAVTVRTTTEINIQVKEWEAIQITNEGEGEPWTASYIDYDESVGAMAVFSSKEEAMASWESWLPLARDVYDKKWAKYGDMPVFAFKDGKFILSFDSIGNNDQDSWEEIASEFNNRK